MKIIYSNNKDVFVLAEEEKPCCVCKKPTKQIEIHFECRVCSDERCVKLVNRFMEETNR